MVQRAEVMCLKSKCTGYGQCWFDMESSLKFEIFSAMTLSFGE
jgi:hypothetical protein